MTRQIFIIGLGNIGGGLYQLIQKRNDMQVAYVCNSKAGVFLDQNQSKSLSLSDLKNLLQNSTSNQFSIDLIQNHPASSKYLIDCTSSQSIPLLYPQLFSLSSQNIKIITPNKKTVSEDINLFNQILKRHETNQFHFETTVCAGLPVINLVKSLVDTHQKIYKISGMFSGTLNYVLSEFMNSEKEMSKIIYDGWKNGITEPNPLDDLSGMDVARKILILFRLVHNSGTDNIKNLADLNLTGLVDFDCSTGQEFFQKFQAQNYDEKFNQLKIQAQDKNQTLKFIAEYDSLQDQITIGLQAIDASHPFYNINGTLNICSVWSEFYDTQPLIISGFGAGTFQTASGILADILKC